MNKAEAKRATELFRYIDSAAEDIGQFKKDYPPEFEGQAVITFRGVEVEFFRGCHGFDRCLEIAVQELRANIEAAEEELAKLGATFDRYGIEEATPSIEPLLLG